MLDNLEYIVLFDSESNPLIIQKRLPVYSKSLDLNIARLDPNSLLRAFCIDSKLDSTLPREQFLLKDGTYDYLLLDETLLVL